jgi:hypothetical protein
MQNQFLHFECAICFFLLFFTGSEYCCVFGLARSWSRPRLPDPVHFLVSETGSPQQVMDFLFLPVRAELFSLRAPLLPVISPLISLWCMCVFTLPGPFSLSHSGSDQVS